MNERAATGERGEAAARRLLVSKGYRILETNYRVRGGELDIVAEDSSGTTVFVEVRSLAAASRVDPSETIDRRKTERLVRAARIYLVLSRRLTKPFRFDFIGIRWQGATAITDHRVSVLRQEDLEHDLV